MLLRHGAITGPIRLPEKDRERFIESFNQLYRGADMTLHALEKSSPSSEGRPGDNPEMSE